jgi:hypothetical protein
MNTTSPRPKQKTNFITLGVIIAAVVLVCSGLGYLRWLFLSGDFGGWSNMCGNYIYQEIPSPDGQYKVIVFQRDCGATTGFSTQVSILGAAQELSNVSGNIFIIDGHPDYTNVQVKWEGDQAVTITYANGYEVDYRRRTFKDSSRVFEIQFRRE